MSEGKTSQEVADDLAKQIKADPASIKTLVAGTVAAGYKVNYNVASHALRKLEKLGMIEKGSKSVVGNIIYHLKPRKVSVKAPGQYGDLSTIGKPSLPSHKEYDLQGLMAERQSVAPRMQALLDDFDEKDHPRAADGKFGSGPGDAKAPEKEASASAKPAKAPKAKAKTYGDAQKGIIGHLEKKGWKVKTGLKVPYATSPDGETRLWFKSQAVYFTQGKFHDFKNARTMSYDLDIRKMEPEEFETYVGKEMKRRDDFHKRQD